MKNFELSVQEDKADDPTVDKTEKETKASETIFEEGSISKSEQINSTTSENEEKSTVEKSSNISGIDKHKRCQVAFYIF